jgi:putative aminopeptidase
VFLRTVVVTAAVLACAIYSVGQETKVHGNSRSVEETVAVSGYEQALSSELRERLHEHAPKTDNLGNIWVTIGSGAPHRLIVAPIDEPGYVVSEITADGYLRVQRLPQAPPNPVFDALHFAQPIWVMTRDGKYVNGVFAGLSVHLQPGPVGDSGVAGPVTGEVTGVNTLGLLGQGREIKAKGTTTIAFVTEQWTGGRGLNRLLTEIHPDEMVFVGRVIPTPPANKDVQVEERKPGSGVLLGVTADSKNGAESLAERLKAVAEKEQILLHVVTAAPPRIAGYAKSATLPENFVELGLPELWPVTPAETVAQGDAERLERLLSVYLDMVSSPVGGGKDDSTAGGVSVIRALTEAYGASGHETAVREEVKKLLPKWAQEKATTDAAGNLVLHVGYEKRDEKTPRIAFVAHMDEIGYEVKKIEDDGRLAVEVLGGGYLQYFLGHVVLVHSAKGPVGGVLELPSGWDKPGFEWPSGPRSMDEPAHVYVGTHSKEETEKLGIAAGDYVTIPKKYRPLLGTRANARSFDDRVGCAALIAAINAIGPELKGRDITFVWSTEEEVGLKGAAAFAEQAAKEGRVPDFVFAIDTFVSSDSPLESKRFGDAEIGKGFVVRAVDNSNVVPREYVDRVVAMAKENGIPAQYGVTGGGNDGAVFLRYGSVDVALGWPLRYSHSPGEVIDTKDLDALGQIVEVLVRKW